MKRIIGGKTFNTETATVISREEKFVKWEPWQEDEVDESEGYLDTETLYQTRQGDFFVVVTELEADFDHGRPIGASPVERLKPLTAGYALDWLRAHHPPLTAKVLTLLARRMEKERTEASAVLLRIPQSLKERLEACAKNKGQSLNTWVMRCLEQVALVEEQGGSSHITPRPDKELNRK